MGGDGCGSRAGDSVHRQATDRGVGPTASETPGGTLMRRLIALVILLGAMPILAQSSAEVNAGIQFNFLNPGASHLGMGGAFIGGADDATAAYANPAGVINILRPEASLEGRLWTYGPSNPESRRGSGAPTRIDIDTISHIRGATTQSQVPARSLS